MCVNDLLCDSGERLGVESETFWLGVRRRNHHTTTPHQLVLHNLPPDAACLSLGRWYNSRRALADETDHHGNSRGPSIKARRQLFTRASHSLGVSVPLWLSDELFANDFLMLQWRVSWDDITTVNLTAVQTKQAWQTRDSDVVCAVLEWSVGGCDCLTADCYRCAVDGGSDERRHRVTRVAFPQLLYDAWLQRRRCRYLSAVHCEVTARVLLHPTPKLRALEVWGTWLSYYNSLSAPFHLPSPTRWRALPRREHVDERGGRPCENDGWCKSTGEDITRRQRRWKITTEPPCRRLMCLHVFPVDRRSDICSNMIYYKTDMAFQHRSTDGGYRVHDGACSKSFLNIFRQNQ